MLHSNAPLAIILNSNLFCLEQVKIRCTNRASGTYWRVGNASASLNQQRDTNCNDRATPWPKQLRDHKFFSQELGLDWHPVLSEIKDRDNDSHATKSTRKIRFIEKNLKFSEMQWRITGFFYWITQSSPQVNLVRFRLKHHCPSLLYLVQQVSIVRITGTEWL
jgi:hypothetical protein